MKRFLFLAALAFLSGAALAQAPSTPGPALLGNTRQLSGPPMAVALEAAQVAIETCKAKDYNIGVAVVDEAGGQRVVLGADNATAADSNGARRAAIFASAQKAQGTELVERMKTDKDFAAQVAANRDWNPHEAALLIKHGDKIIGAIAVEGHPHDGEKDMACAKAGLNQILARLN